MIRIAVAFILAAAATYLLSGADPEQQEWWEWQLCEFKLRDA